MKAENGDSRLRLAFVGGGSGGHLYPVLAVCEVLRREVSEPSFLFLTSHRPVDAKILNAAEGISRDTLQIPYFRLHRFSGILTYLATLPGFFLSFWKAVRHLRRFRPELVVGVGAAASIPGALAGRVLGIPLILMEQNTIPGRATRLLARFAELTQLGIEFSSPEITRLFHRTAMTGTPVRDAIARLADRPLATTNATQTRPRLIILGGSQGSSSVNRIVLKAFEDDRCVPSDWEIIHQTGESEIDSVSEIYMRRGRTATVRSFLPDLPEILGTATIVVSRGGAGTLQELACSGTATIVIPLSTAASDHQMQNAKWFASRGAVAIVEETDSDAGMQLRELLHRWIRNEALRESYRRNIRTLARPQAAVQVAHLLLQFCGRETPNP